MIPHIFLLTGLAASSAVAVTPEPTPSPTPVVIQESEPLRASDVLLAPLAIPPLLVRGVTIPLRSFANWAEDINLQERMIDFFANDERSAFFYPTFRTGGEGGFLAGIGAFHRNLWGKGGKVSGRFQISPGLDNEAVLSVSDSHIGGSDLSLGLSASWRRRQSEAFYGFGNDTADSVVNFEMQRLKVEVPLGGRLGDHFFWKIFNRFRLDQTADRDLPDPQLSALFPASALVGHTERTKAWEGGVRLNLDTRNFDGTPDQGTAASLEFSRFEGESDYGFFRTRATLTQYFRAFLPGRVLAFGAKFEQLNTVGDDEIPFGELASLGGASNLRGFDSNRFLDRSSLLLIAEYRYPVWQLIDGMLFVEGGRVASEIGDLHPDGLHVSYGGGLRFRTKQFFFFQLQGAASSEGARFVFAINQAL